MHNLPKIYESKMYLAMSRKILREKNFPLKYKVIEIKSTYQIWSMDKRKRYFTIFKKNHSNYHLIRGKNCYVNISQRILLHC